MANRGDLQASGSRNRKRPVQTLATLPLAAIALALGAAPLPAAGQQANAIKLCLDFRNLSQHAVSDFAEIRGPHQQDDGYGRQKYASRIDPFGNCSILRKDGQQSFQCILSSGAKVETVTQYFDVLSAVLKDCSTHRVVANELEGRAPIQTRTIRFDSGVCGKVVSLWLASGAVSLEIWNGRALGCAKSPTAAN